MESNNLNSVSGFYDDGTGVVGDQGQVSDDDGLGMVRDQGQHLHILLEGRAVLVLSYRRSDPFNPLTPTRMRRNQLRGSESS